MASCVLKRAGLQARARGGGAALQRKSGALGKGAIGPLLGESRRYRRRPEGQDLPSGQGHWFVEDADKGAESGGSRSAKRGDLLSDRERG
jgi:hypothetical protein